jgi:hypothetical protein
LVLNVVSSIDCVADVGANSFARKRLIVRMNSHLPVNRVF